MHRGDETDEADGDKRPAGPDRNIALKEHPGDCQLHDLPRDRGAAHPRTQTKRGYSNEREQHGSKQGEASKRKGRGQELGLLRRGLGDEEHRHSCEDGGLETEHRSKHIDGDRTLGRA